MAKSVNELSVADLERILSAKRSKLDELEAQRSRLQRELEKVDGKIQELGGEAGGGKSKGRRGPRVKNEKPLWAYVEDVLSRSKKGYTLDEIHQRVLDAGYKSGSENFRNVVYQCLYHSDRVVQDEGSGRYQLKS